MRSRIRDQVMRISLRHGSGTIGADLRITLSPNGAGWAVMGLRPGVFRSPSLVQDTKTREPCSRPDQILAYIQEVCERLERERAVVEDREPILESEG